MLSPPEPDVRPIASALPVALVLRLAGLVERRCRLPLGRLIQRRHQPRDAAPVQLGSHRPLH